MRPQIPLLENVTPTTPLRLEVLAVLAYPDGSMNAKSLRGMRDAGKLTVERTAGKDYSTLEYIEEMRKLCRVQAKVPDSGPTSATAKLCGSSATHSGTLAQVALSAKVQKATRASQKLKKGSPNTSVKNTIHGQTGEVVSLKPQ
jgi:hypothetical protein